MITIDLNSRIIKLDTGNTSYVMMVDKGNYPAHLYYGSRIDGLEEFADLYQNHEGASFAASREDLPLQLSRTITMQEYTTNAIDDYRISSVAVRTLDGCTCTDPRFVSARKFAGKTGLPGMPSTRVNGDDSVETLELILADPCSKVEFILYYTVFPEQDAIARSVKVRNCGTETVYLERAMSICLDLPHQDYDLIQLPGGWARERRMQRNSLRTGVQGFFSKRTSSSHNHNPAFALAEKSADENKGDIYGFLFVYSGSFSAEIEVDTFSRTRTLLGLNPETFEWKLAPGAEFQTPEAIQVFSADGINGMTHCFHDLLREHLISPRWSHAKRPILVNNWEATYFNFNDEKLLNIARDAAKLGIEMLVLDDGWFGHRNDDRSSLGDWFVNKEKIGEIGELVKNINALGLKFGLWFEPEMISPESELYKTHPEWLLTVPGRDKTLGRNQCLLNMANPDVVDYLFDTIAATLHSANIEYIKWDFNRNPAEKYYSALPADQQKELGHRFVLGVYALHQRLLDEFPELLIEGCSGGGGRFDAGILYYAPQIWCSDDTDAIERLEIQAGTSMFYPCSTQGAHVSVCPNHQTGRITPFSTRGNVALSGTFGYELDLTQLSDEDKELVKQQTDGYHKLHHLVTDGDYYCLIRPGTANPHRTSWEFAAKDASEALVLFVTPRMEPQPRTYFLRLKGLDPQGIYRLENTDQTFHGSTLMNAGYPVPLTYGDGISHLWHFIREK